MVTRGWDLLPFEQWRATCDTLHAHTQVLGKLAARLAFPEPQLQHAALRLTARGWESMPLPAPDGSGAIVLALDLHAHQSLIEHSDGRRERIDLAPHRAVGEVTREVLEAVTVMVGPVPFDPRPQEVAWTVPLDQDDQHATYDPGQVAAYLGAATRAAIVLSEVRAPFRGRCTPVNAWWGSFDLAVSLFSGEPADPGTSAFIMRNAMDAEEVAIGWWPGDQRYPRAAYAYAHPAPPAYGQGRLEPPAARFEPSLGEYILDWDDVVASDDPLRTALSFVRSAVTYSCTSCGWDPALVDSLEGRPPPVR
ncbi:MAG TPA: DUF5996 family protein [Acidimicrobiales bacterium]|nr:DUF5996 family protein [Acidimicrobiales bacterium]